MCYLTKKGRKAVEGRRLSVSMTLSESFHFLECITMFLFAMKVRLCVINSKPKITLLFILLNISIPVLI